MQKPKTKQELLEEKVNNLPMFRKVLVETAVCQACFTHFMFDKPITFRKKDFYERRTRRVPGYQCPRCGHLVKVE